MLYHTTSNSIADEMVRQTQGMSLAEFRCDSCVYYDGAMRCQKNVFIAFVGANMGECRYYQWGITCKHCGRRT